MIWPVLGWLGNAGFFSRFLVQWRYAETRRSAAAPALFWILSLLGSAFLGSYALHRDELVLLVGFSINALIYARNLQLIGRDETNAALGPRRVALLGTAAAAVLVASGIASIARGTALAPAWTVVAVIGQALWSGRFVVQWYCSERVRISHFPAAFWWLSLAGNLLLLGYAFALRDAVLIAGFVIGPFLQIRNLILLAKPAVDVSAGLRQGELPG